MLQAFSAWSECPSQKCLYVGILIGPYLTAPVFNHPPILRQDHLEDCSEDERLSHTMEAQHLCDVFPQECAPQLVFYMKHILEDPTNWRMGLSASLRCLFHLATTNIVESFEQQVSQEPSGIFSFEGDFQLPYDATANEKVTASFNHC